MLSFAKGQGSLQGVLIDSSGAESRLARFQLYCAHALSIGEKEIPALER
jgi:hypothetical protein